MTLAIIATDPDLPANDLEFGALGLPPGLAMDPGTGVITGTIASSAVGHYPARVTVTDNASPRLLAIAEFDWKVPDANQQDRSVLRKAAQRSLVIDPGSTHVGDV